MWILLVMSVHINNPSDVPGWVRIPMESQAQCERAQAGVTAWLKFELFKITTQCLQESSSSSPITRPTR
jgi:hypothetical protein